MVTTACSTGTGDSSDLTRDEAEAEIRAAMADAETAVLSEVEPEVVAG